MRAWSLFVDVAGPVSVYLVLIALGWAAIERGRIHREWARLKAIVGEKAIQSLDWCMAMAAAAGCA